MQTQKIHPAVKKETTRIAIGSAIGVAIIFAVYALLKRLTLGVVITGLLGGGVSVLTFFMMGMTVQKATAEADETRQKNRMQSGYNMRMMVRLVYLSCAVIIPGMDWVVAGICMLLTRITIGVMQLLGIYKKEEPAPEALAEVEQEPIDAVLAAEQTAQAAQAEAEAALKAAEQAQAKAAEAAKAAKAAQAKANEAAALQDETKGE